MTVVAALVVPGKDGGAWIGSDCLSSDDTGLASRSSTPKVGRYGELLLGFAGSWRAGYLWHKAASSAYSPSLDQLLDAVKLGEDLKDDWSLLAIERGTIYEINADKGSIAARPNADGVSYGAIGSGASVALGALYVSTSERPDESSLIRALEAAEEHCTSVRSPFNILTL